MSKKLIFKNKAEYHKTLFYEVLPIKRAYVDAKRKVKEATEHASKAYDVFMLDMCDSNKRFWRKAIEERVKAEEDLNYLENKIVEIRRQYSDENVTILNLPETEETELFNVN